MFHFALAVADDRGVRPPASRARAPVSQRHAGLVLCAVRSGLFRLASLARQELRSLVGRVDLALGVSAFNRQELDAAGFGQTGVLPLAVDTSRVTRRRSRPALEHDPGRRVRQLPVRRPHRAEQEDRGSHQAGRALQAVRRCVLSLHLRRPIRRRAALLFDDSRAHVGVSPAQRTIRLHRSRPRRGPGGLLPEGGGLHLAQRTRGILRAAARGDGRRRAGPRLRAPRLSRKRWAAPASQFAPKDLEYAAELARIALPSTTT